MTYYEIQPLNNCIQDNNRILYNVNRIEALINKLRLHSWGKRINSLLEVIVLIVIFSGSAQAMIISADGLLTKIVENNQYIRSFYFDIEAKVYDPEAFSPLEEQTEVDLVSEEIRDKAFFQKVVWVREEHTLIETLDSLENPLNIFVLEPIHCKFSKNLQSDRLFSEEDLLYPYFLFFTKYIAVLKENLEDLGIFTKRVAIKQKESGVVYQLGDARENILVDPITFKVLEINRQIQISGRYFPLQVVFSDWDKQYKQLPITTRFYINGRLFKEMRIIDRKRSVFRERRNFLSNYHKMLPQPYPFSLTTIYSH